MSNNQPRKSSPQIYALKMQHRDQLELVKQILVLHANLTNINHGRNYLRPKLVDVLSFYLLLGYSKDTKNLIIDSLSITDKNLNQINSELSKKGYLIRDHMNFRVKHLSQEMKQLKDYFLDGDISPKLFMIKFNETK